MIRAFGKVEEGRGGRSEGREARGRESTRDVKAVSEGRELRFSGLGLLCLRRDMTYLRRCVCRQVLSFQQHGVLSHDAQMSRSR